MPLDNETSAKIKADLKKAIKLLKDIEPEIERAAIAGIDVVDLKKRATELKISIDKMNLVYGK